MTPLFAALLIFGFLLVLVGLALALKAIEDRSPAFSRWLDENVGQPGPWE